jgi:hypothetical protein
MAARLFYRHITGFPAHSYPVVLDAYLIDSLVQECCPITLIPLQETDNQTIRIEAYIFILIIAVSFEG